MAAHLDMERWYGGGYSPLFMSTVIAWYRGHVAVQTHMGDAQYREVERKQRQRR